VNVNTLALLTAFHGNNPGAIRKLKKEEDNCTQSILSLGSEEHTKTLKSQPHMTGHRVVYLRSIKAMAKEQGTMANQEQNSPSPTHFSL
jgi:hypothetical protein